MAEGGHTMNLEVSGLEEVTRSLDMLTRRCPDKAGDLLRKDARDLRKEVVENTRNAVNTDKEHKRSLGKLGSYKVSEIKGFGSGQYVEISAKSPHFHLVEHGHIQKNRQLKAIGFVPGRHMMQEAVKRHEDGMEETVMHMVDELLKESGWEK